MNLSISGHHLEVTPAIRDYITQKIQRVLNRFDQVINVRVILTIDKDQQKAEATMHVPGKDIFAQCSQPDLYASIDLLIDKLDKQVIKYKQKTKQHDFTAVGKVPEVDDDNEIYMRE